ncbi:MAG: hypothetical protein FWF18_05180 [Dehalococcoidia bacterium]|nr:hypothetical protein [Dehalococcoidia bacterium]
MSEAVIKEVNKLAAIATDMELSASMRTNAIKNMGDIGTREALLALLELAANERLNPSERKLALKQADRIIK